MCTAPVVTTTKPVSISAASSKSADVAKASTYQLFIYVSQPVCITVGKLGRFEFPAGYYVYTGSAKRNLKARIQRHLSKEKRLRWHIDYLLAYPAVTVQKVELSCSPECGLNQSTSGRVLVKDFGASDCQSGCGSHLKYCHSSESG